MRIDVKDRRAYVPARARILTCVRAGALASAVPNGLGSSPSMQSGAGADPVVENRAFYRASYEAIVGDCRTGGRGAVLHRLRPHPLTTIIPLTPTHRGPRLSLNRPSGSHLYWKRDGSALSREGSTDMPVTLQRLWKDLYRRHQGDREKPLPSRFQLFKRVADDLAHALLQIDSEALTKWDQLRGSRVLCASCGAHDLEHFYTSQREGETLCADCFRKRVGRVNQRGSGEP